MNYTERVKINGWKKLRGEAAVSIVDVLKIQPKPFYIASAIYIAVLSYSFYLFGLYSLPTGIFIGGMVAFFGYLTRTSRNIQVELRYLDWHKIDKAFNELNS